MNIFEFTIEILNFASASFTRFLLTILVTSMMGVFSVSIVSALAGFRLFTINKNTVTKKDRSDAPFDLKENAKHSNENYTNNVNVYDMLVNAWEKHKNKKRGKDNSK